MVVLTEEFHGLSLKRKGADESAELFDAGGDGRSGFPLAAWRATKMRRLACRDEPAAVDSAVTPPPTAGQGDVPMGDDAAPTPSLPGDDEKAVVVYGDAGRRGRDDDGDDERSAPCLALRAHADWVRAMLWEADSRTVRELLAGAREQGSDDLALAVVPWVPPSAAGEPSTAEEATTDGGDDDSEGAAAMDVEGGDNEEPGHPWTGQTYGAAAEGFVYRWPQHCMAPPQMPAVAPASAVMWSW